MAGAHVMAPLFFILSLHSEQHLQLARFVPSAGASCSSCVTGFSPTVSCVISNVI